MTENLAQLDYDIHLRGPVLITGSVGDETIAFSESHLSGTALLGMFANHYIKNSHNDAAHMETFQRWFIHGNLRFLNGYILGSDPLGHPARTIPTPLSIQASKENPHDLCDVLFGEDEVPRKAAGGFITLSYPDESGDNTLVVTRPSVEKAISMHHARSNQIYGPGSDKGGIFNYEYINKDQVFRASIIGDLQDLLQFRKWAEQRECYRLGRSKHSEYGAVELTWHDPAPGSFPVQENLTNFAEKLSPELSLTFLSHVILLDENGQPQTGSEPVKSLLENALHANSVPVPDGALWIESCQLRTVEIENYVSVWKARRPAVRAFRMGSTFLLQFDADFFKNNRDQIARELHGLAITGIGERRHEGFGCIAFGLQRPVVMDKSEAASKRILEEQRLNPPVSGLPPGLTESEMLGLAGKQMPEIARKIMLKSVHIHLAEKIEHQALLQSGRFKNDAGGKSTLFSRLLSYAAKCQGDDDFRQRFLANLNNSAREKLMAVRQDGGGSSLWDHLGGGLPESELDTKTTKSAIQKTVAKTLSELDMSLLLLLDYHPLEDLSLCNRLEKDYLTTMFKSLQRAAKEVQA